MIGERMRENAFDSFEDEFNYEDKSTWPAVIICTEIDAGMDYAKILGIKNYIVTNAISQVQGVRARAVIPTPGYLAQVDRAAWEGRGAYDAAMQSFYMSDISHG